jgi:uncharacterized membrane protein
MQPLLAVHIIAGGLAIVVGAAALLAAKGGNLHRKSGMAFVAAMTVMGLSGATLALPHGINGNVIGGLMAAYLVVTAWMTVQLPWESWRRTAIGLMLVAFALGLFDFVLGVVAVTRPRFALEGVPAPAYFAFAMLGVCAGVGDLHVIRSGGVRGTPRLVRHLWRMCFALFIATGSFFSIRARVAKVLPEPFLAPGVRALAVVAPLLIMLYWLWRIRAGRGEPIVAESNQPRISSARSAAVTPRY